MTSVGRHGTGVGFSSRRDREDCGQRLRGPTVTTMTTPLPTFDEVMELPTLIEATVTRPSSTPTAT